MSPEKVSYDFASCREVARELEKKIQLIPAQDLSYGLVDSSKTREAKIAHLIKDRVQNLPQLEALRIHSEFLSEGPISSLLEDLDVTEILILGPNQICYEKYGILAAHSDHFISDNSFQNFLVRICEEARCHWSVEHPSVNGKFRDFRLHLISSDLTQSHHQLSLRRHPKNPWTLDRFLKHSFCTAAEIIQIRQIISQKANFLVIGGTGTGKTSFLNACLQVTKENERCLIIEDTSELCIPNFFSTKLLVRHDSNGLLSNIEQGDLLKQSLRMRPDRLVMGEIRGPEAKDLMMALSTGHEGSFGSLHANSAQQALIRLEMLVQLGAPSWNIFAIRQLIRLSLNYLFVLGRNDKGERRLNGIYKIVSLEEMGLILEKMSPGN